MSSHQTTKENGMSGGFRHSVPAKDESVKRDVRSAS